MALVFMDGFDHYATADITTKWNQYWASGSNQATIVHLIGAYGRRSSNGLRIGVESIQDTSTNVIGHFVGNQGNTFVAGFAFKPTQLVANDPTIDSSVNAANFNATNGNTANSCGFLLSIRYGGYAQVTFSLQADGLIKAYRSGGGTGSGTGFTGGVPTLLGTTTSPIVTGIFQYLEFKVVLHGSAGTVDVMMNGVSIMALTSQNTDPGASLNWDSWAFRHEHDGPVNSYWDFDDYYVLNGTDSGITGQPNDDFLGDCRVDVVYPATEGVYTDSTPSTGSDRSDLIDETPPSAADYNTVSDPGDKDSFLFGANPTPGATVFGVQVSHHAQKVDAGTATIRTITRVGSTDYNGDTLGVSSSARYALEIQDGNPDSGDPWETTDLDAAQFGYEKVS